MAAKLLLHSLADENHPDLQKQIGCMTGIFQMFDRQQVLSVRQIAQKRQLPSSSSSSSSFLDASQLNNIGLEQDLNRIHQQQQAASTESSRPAFSSSSSSYSSSFDNSPYLTQQSMDLKDVFAGRRLSFESPDTIKSSLLKANHLVNNFSSGNFDDKLLNVGESQMRPPGVVAKLMGLEALPDSASSNNSHLEEGDSFTKPLKRKEPKLPIREDFRALEQILCAVQSNWVLETRNQEQVPKFAAPIVIMKPAKLVERQGLRSSSSSMVALGPLFNLHKFHGNNNGSNGATNRRTAKNHSPRKNRSTRSIEQPSPEPQQLQKQSSSSKPVKNLRLRQKKLELEKCLKPPPTPSNSSNPKRQSKSKSPCGKSRSKLPNSNPSEVSGEVTSYRKPIKKSNLQLGEDEPPSAEHPSPVSVLDVSEYTDNELSPAKQEPISNKDEIDRSENWGRPSEINHRKLQNIDHLVQKLRNLNSDHDEESTDYIASLCENRTNPDHRYISEILLTSGLLLRDLISSDSMPFQLHPSGHPINPELFYILEQTKTCSKPKQGRIQRRLIFDAVNEILAKKLTSAGVIAKPRVRPRKVATKSALTARKLLKELCREIDQLEVKQHQKLNDITEGVMNMPESWNDFHGEVSGTVLDIERLIFKDLVNEALIGASSVAKGKPSRPRRLFSK